MFRMSTFGIVIALALTGCTMKATEFKGSEPELKIEEYFLGQTHAWGIFEDRFGNLRRQFFVRITGTMENGVLVLDELFDFSDGEKDRRVWRIKKIDDHTYEGEADDVIGKATGIAYGNALNWSYDLDMKVGDSTLRVHFNDWMFLQPGGVLINRAKVSKWGVEIGEVTLSFSKPKAETAGAINDPMDQYATVGEVREAANQ